MTKKYDIQWILDDKYRVVERETGRVVMQGSLVHIHAYICLLGMGFELN